MTRLIGRTAGREGCIKGTWLYDCGPLDRCVAHRYAPFPGLSQGLERTVRGIQWGVTSGSRPTGNLSPRVTARLRVGGSEDPGEDTRPSGCLHGLRLSTPKIVKLCEGRVLFLSEPPIRRALV